MSNFKIVLFRNKKKKKILNNYKSYQKCLNKFNNLIKDNNVIFEIKYENRTKVNYELAIVCEGCNETNSLFSTDDFGRNVEVSLSDKNFDILKINDFFIDEKIQDYQLNVRISFEFFYKTYLSDNKFKNFFVLNNKFFIQQDESFDCFILKDCDESIRFLQTLEFYLNEHGINNYISFIYNNILEKKWIYKKLVDYGFKKTLSL